MPSYLYLFRGTDNRGLAPEQMQEHLKGWGAWVGRIRESGSLVAGDPLADGGRVITGTAKNVTDGPYGETKDLVGGYLIVSAGGLDAATELARGCPIFAGGGSVEVRELRAM